MTKPKLSYASAVRATDLEDVTLAVQELLVARSCDADQAMDVAGLLAVVALQQIQGPPDALAGYVDAWVARIRALAKIA